MAAVMRMPELAANTPEATLLDWFVAEGSEVAAGDPIATVETAKATVDIEAEVGGTVLQLVVPAGTDVEVGSPILVIGGQGDSLDGLDLGAPVVEEVAPEVVSAPAVVVATPDRARTFASPLARKLSRDAGLELAELVGTGPGGRVVRRDVASAIALRKPDEDPAPPATTAEAEPAFDGHEIPHTRLRRAIAERLTRSKREAPHFYVRGTARVDDLLALREQINEHASARVSVNDLVVMAVAKAHQAVPKMNVIWTADAIRRFDTVDIAVAVATEDGLVTPVVTAVDTINISALSTKTRDFAQRAREGKLRPDELVGGSVTVTNLGMYGTEDFAAIINPPQASILAVGAARDSVVAVDGECTVARTMRFTLSVDHRPVDGAVAAQWMQAFISLLEHPLRIVT